MRREPIPDDMKELAGKYRALKLIEHVADQDDELMEKYFETAKNSPLRKSRELSVNLPSIIKWFRNLRYLLIATRAFSRSSMQLLTICRLLPMFRL